MRPTVPTAHARVVEAYLRAKDAQLPRLYDRVFAPDAELHPSYAMESPFGDARPRIGHADVVDAFRSMGKFFENIVTVVPIETVFEDESGLRSRWGVAMTARDGSGGMVAWGTYGWTFTPSGTLARRLDVGFDDRVMLPLGQAHAAVDRILSVSHPWCSTASLVRAVADAPDLVSLRAWLTSA